MNIEYSKKVTWRYFLIAWIHMEKVEIIYLGCIPYIKYKNKKKRGVLDHNFTRNVYTQSSEISKNSIYLTRIF